MLAVAQMMLSERISLAGPKALIAHTTKVSQSGGGTSSAIDTTGANLLIVHLGCFETGGAGVVTDSKLNTWAQLTTQSQSGACMSVLYYAKNPNVGSGHTFTVANSVFNAFCVATFSNCDTVSPFDVQNGASTASGSPPQSVGSVTPTVNNELIVCGISEYNGFVGAFSIDAGFTIIDAVPFSNGVNFGSTLAYLIQTSSAAVNPAFNWSSGGNQRACTIATFK